MSLHFRSSYGAVQLDMHLVKHKVSRVLIDTVVHDFKRFVVKTQSHAR